MLYAGIVKRKWAINSAFMVFYAFAMTMVCWVIWAYNMVGSDSTSLSTVARSSHLHQSDYLS